MNITWKQVSIWVAVVVGTTSPALVGAWLMLSGFHYFGARETTAVTVVSWQVALLTQFFLVVSFGIAGVAVWGFRRVRDFAVDEARLEAREVAREETLRTLARDREGVEAPPDPPVDPYSV